MFLLMFSESLDERIYHCHSLVKARGVDDSKIAGVAV